MSKIVRKGKCIKYIYLYFFNCYNKVNEISFTYNFDHVLIYIICKFLVATTFYWFDFFLLKISPLKCRFLLNLAPKSFSRCFVWFISIIKMDVNMYLNKHSWNTHFCSPNIHQVGSPQVCHVSYHSFWALIISLNKNLFINNSKH